MGIDGKRRAVSSNNAAALNAVKGKDVGDR